MQQASEAVRDGELLLANGSNRAAMNRAYYAMFYSVVALLNYRGVGA